MEPHVYRRMHEVEDHHWWFAGRREIVRHVLSRLPLPPSPRLLEVGCGTGGNLPMLSRFGEVTGLEPVPEAAALARERGVAHVLDGCLPDNLPAALGHFDVVLLLDVLEHVDDDRAAVRTIVASLAPGGYLLVTVPAFMFLWSRHDVEHHHRRRYVARILQERLQQAGLAIVSLTYYNTLLFPLVAAVRVLARALPVAIATRELDLPARRLNRALARTFGAERHVVSRLRMPFGVSLIAVARSACAAGSNEAP